MINTNKDGSTSSNGSTPANREDISSEPVRRRSNSDLVVFSGTHLCHDLKILFETAVVQSRFSSSKDFLKNLSAIHTNLTDSYALHLRNVIGFFYSDNPAPEEIVASDYCAEGSWTEVRPRMSRTLVIADKRANKILQPLIQDRNPLEGPENWNFDDLTAEIKLVFQLFLKTAITERVSPMLSALWCD